MSIQDNVLQNYIDTIFNKFDRDRSGTLDPNELASFFNDVFAMMGNPTRINDQQARQALMSIDKDFDGKASKM
jgi:Ca2+-binding EF-hand superfamily protein